MTAEPRPALDDVRAVAELAGLAPSVHNTQPWRFTWDGRRLDVAEELSRALPVLDPSGRERVLSCGATVLHARLGFAALGWDTTTTLLPDGDAGAVLARVEVTGRRTATDDEAALVAAVPRRTTDRDPYDARAVPREVLAALAAAAEDEGGWLRVVDDQDDLIELEVLLAHADATQRSDPAYLRELAAWRRDDAPDGVPSGALPSVEPSSRGDSLSLRDFEAGHGTTTTRPEAPPPAEHPTVIVLGTEQDDRRSWLVAGAVVARVLLRATVDGVAAQPVSSVLEVPSLRGRLRTHLGLVGYPQMVLRIGFGTRGPASHRLPVDEVLHLTGGAAPA